MEATMVALAADAMGDLAAASVEVAVVVES